MSGLKVPRTRGLLLHVLALCGYVGLGVLFSWPLPTKLRTHILGSPAGDAGAYVWNHWVFRHELASGNRWPFRTSTIFALTEPADLSLHNYTLFADVVSLPLQEHLGLVASFNVVYLGLRAASAYAMFLLALSLSRARPEAFLAGALFAFSPFLSARGTAHYSLIAAIPLPLFVLFVWRAGQTLRWPWAVAAGLSLGWSAYCDPYYLIFSLLILGTAVAYAALRVSWGPREPSVSGRRLARVLEAALALFAVLVLGITATGGGRIEAGGSAVTLKTLYTPVLLLLLVAVGRALVSFRIRLALREGFRPGPVLGQLAAGCASALVVLAPLLWALGLRIAEGRFVSPPLPWRSSPAGVDLLAFLMPNPTHALFGEPFRSWLGRLRPDGFVESTASLTITGLAVVGTALLRRVPLPRSWVAFTLFFATLSLGPFVWIGGANTCVPTPWALLRYLPGVSLARTPTRFAIVTMLGFAVLFAVALRGLALRAPQHRALLLVVVAAVLGFELAPLPRRLYAADMPAIYSRIAADPCPVRVLELPFGLRDGTRSVGDFSTRAQFHQTFHGKPLLGGYVSRISERRVEAYRRFPVISALITLSEGSALAPEAAERARRAAPLFLRRARVGFVVIDRSRASRKLRRFAVEILGLIRVDRQWPYELLVPQASLCDGGTGGAAHSSTGCSLRPREPEGGRTDSLPAARAEGCRPGS